MKFLVDARLPRRAADWLTAAGCDAVHTLDLAGGNRTPDDAIIELADREQRAVVTKDADFVDSHALRRRPAKLLLFSTGNLTNAELEALMVPRIPSIAAQLASHSFLELGRSGLLIRPVLGRLKAAPRGRGTRTE